MNTTEEQLQKPITIKYDKEAWQKEEEKRRKKEIEEAAEKRRQAELQKKIDKEEYEKKQKEEAEKARTAVRDNRYITVKENLKKAKWLGSLCVNCDNAMIFETTLENSNYSGIVCNCSLLNSVLTLNQMPIHCNRFIPVSEEEMQQLIQFQLEQENMPKLELQKQETQQVQEQKKKQKATF